jgi:hypothetical protein
MKYENISSKNTYKSNINYNNNNSVALVRERTIPTEQLPHRIGVIRIEIWEYKEREKNNKWENNKVGLKLYASSIQLVGVGT